MWTVFIALGVLYTLQNIQENTERYMEMKTRSELFAERNVHKAFPITTICLNSMHSKRESKVIQAHLFVKPFILIRKNAKKCGSNIYPTYIVLLCRIV